MLYFIECMGRVIFNGYGWNNDPLKTTNEYITWKDIGVGLLGWLIVVILILFIAYLVVARRNKKQQTNDDNIIKEKSSDFLMSYKKHSNFFRGFLYFMECIALGFLCIHGGTNRKMNSTGKKPTKKEVILCLIGWLLIFLIILSIVLICN